MCNLLHHNQIGISRNIIYFLTSTSFVQIPTRNSMNPISKTAWFPALLRVLFSKWQLLIMFPKRVRKSLSDLSLLSSVASKLLKGVISFIQTKLSLIWQWSFDYRNNAQIFPFHTCVYELMAWLLMSSFSQLFILGIKHRFLGFNFCKVLREMLKTWGWRLRFLAAPEGSGKCQVHGKKWSLLIHNNMLQL